jgi:hypothetical protein
MAEHRAARIVHRLLSPQSSWGQFERILVSQQRPDWNQAAVGAVCAGYAASAEKLLTCAWFFAILTLLHDKGREENPVAQHVCDLAQASRPTGQPRRW